MSPRARDGGAREQAAQLAVLQHITATWLASYASENTRAAYRRDLGAFTTWCAAEGIGPLAASTAQLQTYRDAQADSGASAATLARHVSSLRAFYDTAIALGAVSHHPLPRATRATDPRADAPQSDTAVLTPAEADRLLVASHLDPRTAVLVHMLLRDGVRLGEALALDHDHVSGSRRAKVIRVNRHGRAHRIELDPQTSTVVHELQLAGDRKGPLLVAKSHEHAGHRITRFGADQLIKRAGRRVGITDVSANVLRRTHAAHARSDGDDDEEIRVRMGHRDVRTTRRYLGGRRSEPGG